MKPSFSSVAAVMVSVALAHTDAFAAIRIVRGQFAERVERGQPIGDGATARASGMVTYFLVVNNPGEQADITIEWIVNGSSVGRQVLSIGRAPRWRTWASHRVGRTSRVEIKVTDAAGTVIHQDQLGSATAGNPGGTTAPPTTTEPIRAVPSSSTAH